MKTVYLNSSDDFRRLQYEGNIRKREAKTKPTRNNERPDKYTTFHSAATEELTKIDLEKRFECLQRRLEKRNSEKTVSIGPIEPSCGFRAAEKEVDDSDTSSSGSAASSTIQLYDNTGERQQHIFIGKYSRNVDIGARDRSTFQARKNTRSPIVPVIRNSESSLFQNLDSLLRRKDFKSPSANQKPGKGLLIDRQKTPANSKIKKKVAFALHESSSEPNQKEVYVCQHCRCCEKRKAKESGGRVQQVFQKDIGPKQRSEQDMLDSFTQLQQVVRIWKEIAKRYVPKSNWEFWNAVGEDITPNIIDDNRMRIRTQKVGGSATHDMNDDMTLSPSSWNSDAGHIGLFEAHSHSDELLAVNEPQTLSFTTRRNEWNFSGNAQPTFLHNECSGF